MTGTGVAKTLLSGAVGAVALARDLARHASWYVRYQLDGTTHDEEPPHPGERRTESGR